MKFLALILTYILCLNAFAAAPLGVSGQADTSNQYPPVIQVPNSLATNIGGGKTLLETGNNNLLQNPSFEHSTFNTGWTCTGVTPVVETTTVAPGSKKAMKLVLSAATGECYQDSTIGAANAASVQFLAMMRAKGVLTAGTGKVCVRTAGVTSTTLCNATIDDTFNYRKMPFMGNTTSNGISFVFTSATGTIYLDDALVAPQDVKQDIPFARFFASKKIVAGGTGCDFTLTTSTLSSPGAVAGCNTPTSSGNTSDTTKDPHIRLTSYPAGRYYIVASGAFYNGATNNQILTRITDGTKTGSQQSVYSSTATVANNSIVGQWENTSPQASATISVQIASANNTSVVGIYTSGIGSDYEIAVYYFPTANGSTYSSTNADTDWVSCGHTTSSFVGLGTVTAIETHCKRDGGDILMKGKFTTGTTTATEARISLPLWYGTQIVSKGTSVIPSIQIAGKGTHASVSTTFFSGITTLIEPSVSYITIGLETSSNNGLTKVNGTALFSTTSTSFHARIPIEGWENSNVIIGSFNEVMTTPGQSKVKEITMTYGNSTGSSSAPVVCSASPCSIYTNSSGSFSSLTWSSTGVMQVTVANGTFAANSEYECQCKGYVSGSGVNCVSYANGNQTILTNSSGGLIMGINSTSMAGTAANSFGIIKCRGIAP